MDYDVPGFYCKNAGDWPPSYTCTNDPEVTTDRLSLFDGVGNLIRRAYIYFEHGTWDTGIDIPNCSQTANYQASVKYLASGATLVTAFSSVTALTSNCKDRHECPGGTSAGLPVNLGSGDVMVRQPLFSIAQDPMSLPFTLTYHSSAPAFPSLVSSAVGAGWTHEYAQTLRPEDGTNNRLYQITAEGYEHEYLRIAPDAFWIAISPAELRGTITQSGSNYLLTDLNGTVASFDVSTGHWNSTTDRWGNSISGSYTGGQLTTVTDSMGRQIQLSYTSGLVTITLPNSKTWKLTLNSGLLTAIRDPLHPSTDWRTYTYVNDHASVQRLLTSIKDDAGKELEGHTYDNTAGTGADRGLTSYQAGGTRSNVSISYNDAGNTRTVTHTIDGSTQQTTTVNVAYLGARWLPTQITGNCATCGGSNSDLQIFTYDYSNHVIDKKEGSEQIDTTYTYDGNGMLLSRTDPIGTTTYTYAQGTPAGFTGAWPAFLTSVTEPSVGKPGVSTFKTTTYSWATAGSCAGQGNERCLQATVTGYLTPTDGSTTSYQTTTKFDSRHRQIEVDGPEIVGGSSANRKTTFAYFADAATNNGGRLSTNQTYTSVSAHLDTTLDLYDLYGTATKVVDPNSVETDKTTDDRGRVTSMISKKPASDPTEPADYTTAYAFDSRDRLTDVTLPRSNKLHYDYEDGTNRLLDTVRVDSSGNQQERLLLTLNVIGDKIQEDAQACSSPANPCLLANWSTKRTESFKYDTHNRLSEIDHTVPSGSKVVYAYDSRGNLKTAQDENHASANTTYVYDSRSRLTSVTQNLSGAPVVTGTCAAVAGTIATCYGYDLQDNLISVTDPNGNQTTYAYDDSRRMEKQVSPVTATTTYSYDAAGNLTSSTDANTAMTTRTYDSANRVLTASSVRSGFATENTIWSYDDAVSTHYGNGRLGSMTDPSGSTSYAYERRGLLRYEGKTIGPNTYTLSYGYDANGNRSSLRYPSGRLVSYAFDFADRPITAASGTTNYVSAASYQPFGPESSIAYGNGTAKTVTYDQRYRVTENKLTNGAPAIADFLYSEDAVGNITSICAAQPCTTPSAPYDRVFAYDDLNRLTTAKSGSSLWGSASGNGYAYDSMGNMTSTTLGSTTRTFTYVQNGSSKNLPKLASVNETGPGNRNVTYDSAGNETAVGGGAFSYSSRNYLASGDNLSYAYDGRGLRAAATRTSVTLFPIALTIDPISVMGGAGTTGKVTLNDTTGGTVTLSSSDVSVTVPATVSVSAGQASSTFSITTAAVASDRKATVTATLNGVAVTAVITVTQNAQLLLVSLSPRAVHGGNSVTGTVVLNGQAPAGNAVVNLVSSNVSVATVPTSATVTAGQTIQTFAVTTLAVTSTKTVDISGTYNAITFHAALMVTNLSVERRGTGGELLLASLGTWRPERGSFSLFSDPWWEHPVWPDLGWGRALSGSEFEFDDPRLSVEVASVPGPPSRNFIYSPEMNLLAESELTYPREKRIIYEYIWFNGHPVAQVDGTAVTHWTFTDHLGTPQIQTDTTGAVWWRAEYEPYGKVYAFNPPSLADQHQPLRLPGQEAEQFNLGMNGATERSYNIFRWYRSSWGRYMQADPVGLWPSTNLFAYVDGNPLAWFDLRGLCGMVCCNDYDKQKLLTRLDQATRLQQSYLRHTPGPPPGEVQVGGITYCSEGPNGKAAPGVAVTSITKTSPGVCLNICNKRHEQSNRDLCSRQGVNGFKDGSFVEALGYAAEINCLTEAIVTGRVNTCGINF